MHTPTIADQMPSSVVLPSPNHGVDVVGVNDFLPIHTNMTGMTSSAGMIRLMM